ncbi:hypothetical protein D3C77_389470 [compost metagenome]
MNRRGGAGQVVDLIEAAQFVGQGIVDVLRHQMEAIGIHQMSDVGVSACMKIIDAGHMMTGFDQSSAQVRSEKARSAGYGDSLAGIGVVRRRIRKAIVIHRFQPC